MNRYKLSELIEIKNGKDHKELPNGDYPVFGSGGIMRFVDSYLYDKPSVLLPRKGTLNNIQYYDKPFWTVDTLYYTEINEDLVCPYYLYCYLRLLDMSILDTGTGVPSMTFDSYYNIEVFLPNIEEQRQIASVLQGLDYKIALNRQINDNLEAMAKQLYDYWFVQFDFPNEEGKPYKSSGGAMVWNDVVKQFIPESWNVYKVKDLLSVITGKQDANFASKQGKYKFFTCSQETLNCDVAEFEGSAILIAGNGDFNVKHYTGSFNAYQRTYVLIPPVKYYAVVFMATSMLLEKFKKNSSGSIIKFITKGDVENITVFDCGDDTLYNKLNNLFFMIEQNNKEIEKLTKQRDELLPLLMNGQASVNYHLSDD